MFKAAAFSLVAMALAIPAAHAQLSKEGGPIEITADRGELDDVNRKAVYRGNVDVIQGVARLRANEVVISYHEREGGAAGGGLGGSVGGLDTIIATGDVYYITDREKMKADRGLYNAAAETITLTGNVKVTNDDGVIAGQQLVIEITTGRYTMDGGEGGRVKMVLESAESTPIQ